MGKRSSFARAPRDFYPTPREAVAPLLPHLPPQTWYAEPCVGDRALVKCLSDAGHRCVQSGDIETGQDARDFAASPHCRFIITNPPWSRPLLHDLIVHFSDQRPTWLLFDADWMHTRQAAPFLPRCRKIVSVGRVKWIPDSPHTGKDNACWYLFKDGAGSTEFVGRMA